MKRNKLLRAFDLADEKYVSEADPTKSARVSRSALIRKYALAACLCLIMTACCAVLFTPYDTTPPDVSQYSDSEYYGIIEKLNVLTYTKPKYKNKFEEISSEISRAFMSAKAENYDDLIYENTDSATSGIIMPVPDDALDGADKSESSYEEVTDNQVKGVTESDRIKRSSKYIFYLDGMTLKSFAVKDGELELISQYNLLDKSVGISGSVQLPSVEFYLTSDCGTIIAVIPYFENGSGMSATKIHSVRVDDDGVLLTSGQKTVTIDGDLNSTRMINGKLLIVSNFMPQNIDFKDPTTFIPTITEDGDEKECISGENIIVPDTVNSKIYTVICKLDAKTLEPEGQTAILSYTQDIYVTTENVYVTRSYTDMSEEDGFTVRKRMTDIVCVSFADGFENKGEITIEGYINDRYSLDEYNGILRVVTTTDASKYMKSVSGNSVSIVEVSDDSFLGTSANLYCISTESWEVVAGVYRFAPVGETVRSVRYDGNMAYVCTAVQTKDPVFFFDLTDLSNIVCKDTGEIEGFSTSLVNFGNGYLLGIGQGANWGSLKVEIYRETETGVESVAAYESENTYISAYYKAYYIDRENQLIGFGVYGGIRSYLVLHFNRDTMELEIAAYTNLNGDVDLMRGVYIDGYFHMFGSNEFKTVKLQ